MDYSKDLVYCIPCKKTCYHENQWRDHLSSDLHEKGLFEWNRQKDLKLLVDRTVRSGQHFMILDLEGNIIPVLPKTPSEDMMMILLEISYLIFKFDSESKEFQIVHTFNSLVKAGDKKKDYDPSLLQLLNFTMAHKHGLSFTTCQEKGIVIQQAWKSFKEDMDKYECQRILAKGAGMERMFVQGCRLQHGFTADGFDNLNHLVLDLDDIFKVEKISHEELMKYRNCGNHLPDVKTKQLLHCSLAEVYCYFHQLEKYINSLS